jgi:hypothetical protein
MRSYLFGGIIPNDSCAKKITKIYFVRFKTVYHEKNQNICRHQSAESAGIGVAKPDY